MSSLGETEIADEPVLVRIDGPTIVGFFPPELRNDESAGAREGRAHVHFALSDVAKCLGDRGANVRLEFARDFLISDGGRTSRIEIRSDFPHAVGAIVARPGAAPRIVYATAGPSSLLWLLAEATADYFEAPACLPRRDQPPAAKICASSCGGTTSSCA